MGGGSGAGISRLGLGMVMGRMDLTDLTDLEAGLRPLQDCLRGLRRRWGWVSRLARVAAAVEGEVFVAAVAVVGQETHLRMRMQVGAMSFRTREALAASSGRAGRDWLRVD